MIPKAFLVRQQITHPVISDAAECAAREIVKCDNRTRIKPGDRVAIAAGSRGIHDIAKIARSVVDHFKELGAKPFLFPAMGCHGGGNAAGQKATLEHLGMTEKHLGCPIRSEIDPREIATTIDGTPVYMDVNALAADHLMVMNRIKPHSDFFGVIGSGLVKMLVIGCGKMKGADTTHEAAITHGLEHMLLALAEKVIERMPVLGGLGVIEGPTAQIVRLSWVQGDKLIAGEAERFSEACRLAPAIPISSTNLLVIDWMGKNISGCGIDPFVIGRQEYLNVHASYTDFRADRIYVGNLTEESLGNADGIGMADATSQRLVQKLDYDAIRIGVMTSRTLPLGRIPIAFASDRDAINALLGTTSVSRKDASFIRIKNTTDLEYLEISENLLGEWQKLDLGSPVAGPYDLAFDDDGVLLPLSPLQK